MIFHMLAAYFILSQFITDFLFAILGTLLNSKSQISSATAEALKEASSRGVKVVIATGKVREIYFSHYQDILLKCFSTDLDKCIFKYFLLLICLVTIFLCFIVWLVLLLYYFCFPVSLTRTLFMVPSLIFWNRHVQLY